MPWQIAFALQDDGWIIRNAIVWHHPNTPVETTSDTETDRFPNTYELIFLLVKQNRYWFDLDPIRQALQRPEVAADPPAVGGRQGLAACTGASARRRPGTRHTDRHDRHGSGIPSDAGQCRSRRYGTEISPTEQRHAVPHSTGKNPGDVWSVAAWEACPIEVPLRCIAAGCRPGGTVLDPFAGIATTGVAARALGRGFIGIENDPANCLRVKQALSEPHDTTGERDEQ